MSNLEIEKIIAHDINLGGTTPKYFENIIQIKDSEILNFFIKHLENAMKTKQIRLCNFIHDEASVLRNCIEIAGKLDDDQLFINSSKNMTQSLLNNMGGSASTGALIFIRFVDKLTDNRYLSIMKMDPNNGVRLDRSNFTFIVQKDILPSVHEKLHKCAFIKLCVNLWDEPIHLRVLDKQQVTGEISKYFLGFLEAKTFVDDKAMTEIVSSSIRNFAIEEKIINTKQLVEFSSKVEKILSNGNEVDLDRDLESLFSTYIPGEADREGKIDKYKQTLIEKHQHAYFQFVADKKPTIAMFSSDSNDIKIQFPVQYHKTKILVDYKEDEDGNMSTFIKITGVELKQRFKN